MALPLPEAALENSPSHWNTASSSSNLDSFYVAFKLQVYVQRVLHHGGQLVVDLLHLVTFLIGTTRARAELAAGEN